MKDKNHFSGHMGEYGIIPVRSLSNEVCDELSGDCPSNDSGRIVNPEYNDKFNKWLTDNNMPIECYIIWWSW